MAVFKTIALNYFIQEYILNASVQIIIHIPPLPEYLYPTNKRRHPPGYISIYVYSMCVDSIIYRRGDHFLADRAAITEADKKQTDALSVRLILHGTPPSQSTLMPAFTDHVIGRDVCVFAAFMY